MAFGDLSNRLETLWQTVTRLQDAWTMFRKDLDHKLNKVSARDAWQVAEEDNVDNVNGLLIDIYVPPNGTTRHIQQVLVRVRLKAFRSYSAVTAGGGGTTATSSNGGGSSVTTPSGGGSTSGANVTTTTSTNSTSFSVNWASFSQMFGTIATVTHTHAGAVAADGGASHDIPDHYHPHTHELAHTHSTPDHQHSFTDPVHTHDVTLSDHTHNITAAITLGATASGCTIWINGTDRTVALTGAATFGADQNELDVTQYITATGYNTVEVRSATLGRIRCTAFVNLYLNDR